MEKTLNFTKTGSFYKATYTSEGETSVQLQRAGTGLVTIYANIPGMDPSSVFADYQAKENFLLKVCVPQGMVVTVESQSEVITCKIWTEVQ